MAGKKRIVLILGASGMLGSGVYSVLRDKYNLIVTVRDSEEIDLLEKAYPSLKDHRIEELELKFIYDDYVNAKGYLGEYLSSFLGRVGRVDYVINAIGITVPYSLENPAMTFFINSAWPHMLANVFGSRLIHVTTDCVFNGKEGFPYDENSPKTPTDIYGLAKSLGEPMNCLTLRTSLVGRELKGLVSLLDWFLQQEGKTIQGYSNHFWNGVTVKQFGEICHQIMQNPSKFPAQGIYHVFSNVVSKYEMLLKFREKYNLDCEIVSEESNRLNRTLSTVYPLCAQLQISSFDEALKEL